MRLFAGKKLRDAFFDFIKELIAKFFRKEPVAELASGRNFKISGQKRFRITEYANRMRKEKAYLKISLSPTDEFGAAERWKLQSKLIRQQALKGEKTKKVVRVSRELPAVRPGNA